MASIVHAHHNPLRSCRYDAQKRGCIETVLDQMHETESAKKEFRITKDYLEDVCGVGETASAGSQSVAAEAEQIEVASTTATGADAASDSDSTPNWTCGGDESVMREGQNAVDQMLKELCRKPLVQACPLKVCADAMIAFDDNMCSKELIEKLSAHDKEEFTNSYIGTRDACST